MKIFGLTGGIASGKSTVAKIFREQGLTVVDADQLYHSLIAPEDGKPSSLAQTIEKAFPGVLTPKGTIDRRLLGQKIFHHPDAREQLNRITHPAVAQAFSQAVQQEQERGRELIIYDVPLLYESGKEDQFHGVIVVWLTRELQIKRLCSRNHFSIEEAHARLTSQLSLNEKRHRADYVIDNCGSFEETHKQTLQLLRTLGASHHG